MEKDAPLLSAKFLRLFQAALAASSLGVPPPSSLNFPRAEKTTAQRRPPVCGLARPQPSRPHRRMETSHCTPSKLQGPLPAPPHTTPAGLPQTPHAFTPGLRDRAFLTVCGGWGRTSRPAPLTPTPGSHPAPGPLQPRSLSLERLTRQPPARSFRGPAAAAAAGNSSSPPPPPPPPPHPTFNPQHSLLPPHPGLAPPPLGTAPQLPSWAPKSPVRTPWRGSNFLLAPPTPPKRRRRRRLLGSLQLSAEPQHRSRRAPPPAPPSSLPARSNTLRELLCPPRLGLTVLVRGTGPPLPTRGSSHRPSPPLPSPPTPPPPPPRHCRARLPPQRPATSSRSLRGTRKGNVRLRLVSLRRGHRLPPAFPTPPRW
ncbi:uncharacterized protein LOC129538583 [Moschus berezovskii]|uniref:uncharacterized protein LOC129538583 n=1 Tax=Moschus berezovskii TaxID=68408 RepID=UPI00244528A4|nr:uncharacterized protein LOC129538583 [Moschus berezovskii]